MLLTCSYSAGNQCKRITINFIFTSNWITKLCDFFLREGPCTWWNEERWKCKRTISSFIIILLLAIFLSFVFTSDQKRKDKKSSDEESESEDDPVKLQKKRDWDEWKDGKQKLCLLFPRGNQIVQGFGKCYTEAWLKNLNAIWHGSCVRIYSSTWT